MLLINIWPIYDQIDLRPVSQNDRSRCKSTTKCTVLVCYGTI
jgi:hypothetical protein